MMVSVFLPTRKGSERVLIKNTRDFAGVKGGLLKLKLLQLIECCQVGEIVLSTNDEASVEVALSLKSEKIKICQRPDYLALSSTSLVDLVKYVPGICEYENILWTHVTSPFVQAVDYTNIIKEYFIQLSNGFDSLMTVKPLRNFLWDNITHDIINRTNEEKWPRTQDLKVYFEIDSAVFLSSKRSYKKHADRIGLKPFLYEMEGIKSFDVDWEEDFKIAEVLYKGLNG